MNDLTRSISNGVLSIREINSLPDSEKYEFYERLLPDWALNYIGVSARGIAPHLLPNVTIWCPVGSRSVEITVRRSPEDRDPVTYLHMTDTLNMQILVLLLIVNDLDAPRFDTDIDADGRATHLGTVSRNIAEELSAMRAGLAPGQIRQGLRTFGQMVPLFEEFIKALGHLMFFIEPMAYHNAIVFERYGFNYLTGYSKMVSINQEFQPGGQLHQKLDGSTPFRMPNAWESVRGRSWAIHDGILGYAFSDFRMYKHIGKSANVNTFPNYCW